MWYITFIWYIVVYTMNTFHSELTVIIISTNSHHEVQPWLFGWCDVIQEMFDEKVSILW